MSDDALQHCLSELQACKHQRCEEAGGTTGVFPEEPERTAMECLQRCVSRVATAASTCMYYLGSAMVDRLPACVSEPATEVRVLPVEEEALVHAANLLEGRQAYQHAGTRNPVDLHRLA